MCKLVFSVVQFPTLAGFVKQFGKISKCGIPLAVIVMVLCRAAPALEPARHVVVGFVLAGKYATISGKPVQAASTILSGDRVSAGRTAATLAIAGGGKITIGQDAQVTFRREQNEVLALLDSGGILFSGLNDATGFRVRAGNISVAAKRGWNAAAIVEVTTTTLAVAAREGFVRVEGDGHAIDLTKGRAIQLAPALNSDTGGGGSGGAGGGAARRASWNRYRCQAACRAAHRPRAPASP